LTGDILDRVQQVIERSARRRCSRLRITEGKEIMLHQPDQMRRRDNERHRGRSGLAWAAGQYGPGASDTEIKIGNTIPYSGPASAYGTLGKSVAAYFAMINDQGGLNGRKINFISRDDGYSPPKTVEQVRKLVEEDQVLLMFSTLGTPPNTTIQGYLNDNKVPQLFVATGADKWNDPKHHPWTMAWLPTYQTEARIYARYILKNLPRQDRGALSERRFRQGLLHRPA
jgi:branched-chain amino acid transport system substrate-binding protein